MFTSVNFPRGGTNGGVSGRDEKRIAAGTDGLRVVADGGIGVGLDSERARGGLRGGLRRGRGPGASAPTPTPRRRWPSPPPAVPAHPRPFRPCRPLFIPAAPSVRPNPDIHPCRPLFIPHRGEFTDVNRMWQRRGLRAAYDYRCEQRIWPRKGLRRGLRAEGYIKITPVIGLRGLGRLNPRKVLRGQI